MADREYVYTVKLNAAQAATQAARVRAIFQRELSQIRINPTVQAQRPTAIGGGAMGGSSSSGGRGRNNELIPGFDNVANLAGYTIAGTAITQLGRMAADTTIALTEQGTALRRADFTANELAGSTERLSGLMRVYQQVTGDAQTTGESMADINQLMAVGFADSEKELRRFLTAARGADMATGRGLDYIVQQLQLTIANQSEQRLDQIGLGIGEVQDRIKQLKNTMPELTKEAAYQEAVIGLLNEKYGSLVTSAESGASGLELFRKQLREVREEAARNVEQQTNPIFEGWAVRLGSQNVPAQVRSLQGMAETNRGAVVDMLSGGLASEQADAFERMANLLEEVTAAALGGGAGMEELQAKVQALASEMLISGNVTEQNIALVGQLETDFRVAASGGVIYADAMDEASQAARRLAASQEIVNATFKEALGLLSASYQGTMYVNLPGVGLRPDQFPGGPSDDYMRQQSIQQGGGFLTPGGASVGDMRSGWMDRWRQQNEENDREDKREREQAAQKAIRDGERVARETENAMKRAADNVEGYFRDAANELKSQIMEIPGLIGTSQVTAEQMKMAELGVGQSFADDIRRRLEDEVINKHDWADIDPGDLFRRAGIDGSLPDEAKMALFNQKWADSSLFANTENLDLFNQQAVQDFMFRQEQSKLGQANILSMFGLGEDDQGAYFTGLGGTVADGMMTGAQEGLADFGRQAIQDVMGQLRSDAAMSEYAQLGALQFDAMAAGWLDASDSNDLVAAFTARVVAQIADMFGEEQP